VSLGLNKQTYNMARLKVKQISDFTAEVQSLITANDTNDAASIAALSTAVGVEQSDQNASITSLAALATGGGTKDGEQDASIDLLQSTDVVQNASIDALQAVDASLIKQLSDNDADNADLTLSVNSLETAVSVETTKNAEQDNSIDLLQSADIALSAEIVTEKDRIDAILASADADKDTFVEIVSLINSVDKTNDDAFAAYALATDASIDSLEKVDQGLQSQISSNDTDISNLQASVDALATADGYLANSVNSLETAVSVETTRNNDQDASINSLELLAGGTTMREIELSIDALEASVDSLELVDAGLATAISALQGADFMLHQEAIFVSTTEFRLPAGVRYGANDDIHVHINGHTIKPFVQTAGDDTEKQRTYADHGWSTVNGVNFTLTGIGYPIDATDVLYVQAIKA